VLLLAPMVHPQRLPQQCHRLPVPSQVREHQTRLDKQLVERCGA
jgi:hypothetical protein